MQKGGKKNKALTFSVTYQIICNHHILFQFRIASFKMFLDVENLEWTVAGILMIS